MSHQFDQVSWTHYRYLLPLANLNKIKYYINIINKFNLSVTELKAEYIGQISKYIGYVDKNIRKPFHEKTVGVIICKKNNEYIMEYCTNPSIFTTIYLLEGSKI